MSTKVSSFKRYSQDHFVPDVSEDTAAQRRLRGQLEQIDYTAYASNKEVVGAMLGHADAQKFQRIAVAAASARAQWVKEALAMSEKVHLDAAQSQRLADLRKAYEELTEVYEAMRRMVERGYLVYRSPAAN
jgi:MFS superfamily sulfate permease-like transporter